MVKRSQAKWDVDLPDTGLPPLPWSDLARQFRDRYRSLRAKGRNPVVAVLICILMLCLEIVGTLVLLCLLALGAQWLVDRQAPADTPAVEENLPNEA